MFYLKAMTGTDFGEFGWKTRLSARSEHKCEWSARSMEELKYVTFTQNNICDVHGYNRNEAGESDYNRIMQKSYITRLRLDIPPDACNLSFHIHNWLHKNGNS